MRKKSAVVAGVALLLAGCASLEQVINLQNEINLPTTTWVRSASAPAVLSMSIEDVVLQETGQNLEVTLDLENLDDEPLLLTFTSGKEFDILVRDSRGKPFMRWSDNRAFTMALHDVVIEPGESLRRQFTLELSPQIRKNSERTYTVVGMTAGGIPLTTEPLIVRYVPEDD